MKHILIIPIFSAAFALAGCVTGPSLAPQGVFDAGSYTLPLKQNWTVSEIKTGKRKSGKVLTMDGRALNAVFLFSDLAEGDSLMAERKKEKPVPKFSADLSDLELVEFVTESLQRGQGLLNLVTKNVTPSEMAGEDAIQFEFTAVDENGLNQSGAALVANNGQTMDLILYMAPSVYYFNKNKADIDAMFESAIGNSAS